MAHIDTLTVHTLAGLLESAGDHHHRAFAETDGGDPEWPLWYAGFLQTRLWEHIEQPPTRSRLVHLLLAAEHAHGDQGGDSPWPQFYAERMLPALHPAT